MLVRAKPQPSRETGEFFHHALIYDSVDDFVDAALPFVSAGIEAGEPVLARVKSVNADALSEALGADAAGADVAPAEGFYATPSRTRAKFLDWVADRPGGRVRILGEPPWPLDSEAGVREWARHESVINVAFWGMAVSFACPYDESTLPEAIIESAESTASPDHALGRQQRQRRVRAARAVRREAQRGDARPRGTSPPCRCPSTSETSTRCDTSSRAREPRRG